MIAFKHTSKTFIGIKKYEWNIAAMRLILSFLTLLLTFTNIAAQKNTISKYTNPIIYADYSDPDVIRVGKNYYMIASSFNSVPGLPILHSTNLVNWQLINYALPTLTPFDHYSKVQAGGGVWAPSIRYHNGEFYIYYPDPDFGIYLTKTKNIKGKWSEPILVQAGKGLIDPCPLWDNDGKCYLVHAYAGSRAGIKSILVIKEMDASGTKIIAEPVLVYDGHDSDPTIEGPKIYKRNGYYYILAPAGGVSNGWQLALRSKNIYGPYERNVVMQQGKTSINGPHQGAWITDTQGKDWFIHFQDKDAYGRIVHLQPMQWVNDFPVIGYDEDKDGTGEPVLNNVISTGVSEKIATNTILNCSDNFNNNKLGLQWQWQANPKEAWAYATSTGTLKMFSILEDTANKNLFYYPNILTQKFPADSFSATVKTSFHPSTKINNEKFGFIVLGTDYACISIVKSNIGNFIEYSVCTNADNNKANEKQIHHIAATSPEVYFKITVGQNATCNFSYSFNGIDFINIPETFIAKPGKWVGAKLGFFCSRKEKTNDSGWADIDWFRVE